MDKNLLREKYINVRSNLSDISTKSNIIIEKLLNLEMYKSAKTICTYVSFGNEVDTLKLIKTLLKDKKTVAVPKVLDASIIDFYPISSLNELIETSSFGIKEPYGKKDPIQKNNIDLVIVPGICFDRNKHRLGFGKGYYDTYLSSLPGSVIKIGICFDEQVSSIFIPALNHDVKMDIVITDKQIF